MERSMPFAAGLFLATATILAARVADAQFVQPNYYAYGAGNYGYGGGSYANGMADVIRGRAEATVTYEAARSASIDDDMKWAKNYYKMKEMRDDWIARHKEGQPSAETLAAVARSNLPRKLGSHTLDPVTGHITWPELLQRSDYAAPRSELEHLFAQRAQTSQAVGTADKIHAVTAELAKQLRRHIEDVPAKEYMSARKFLDSLDYAAHTQAG